MPQRPAVGAERTRGAWILLGDEDEVAARRLEKDLHSHGHRVTVCHSLEESLDSLASNSGIQVILLSDRLPGGEGVKGVCAVRAVDESSCVVLMMAAPSDDEGLFQGYQSGADMVLVQPVYGHDLDPVLRSV